MSKMKHCVYENFNVEICGFQCSFGEPKTMFSVPEQKLVCRNQKYL